MKKTFKYAEPVTKYSVSIKTVSMRVDVAKRNYPEAVCAAFDLAKSGGRELNLTFTSQPGPPSSPKTSRLAATP